MDYSRSRSGRRKDGARCRSPRRNTGCPRAAGPSTGVTSSRPRRPTWRRASRWSDGGGRVPTRHGLTAARAAVVELSGRVLSIGDSYDEGGEGIPAAIVGSTGRLEVFVKAGSARDVLAARRGAAVHVRRGA